MKKIAAWFLPLLICIYMFPSFTASAIVEKSEEFYVNDSAGVLSDKVEQAIIAANADLERYCKGAQLVIVTVDDTDGLYSDEYAHTLFYDWGVGNETENNGMLLLMIIREDKGWLAVGDGIDEVFTDYIAERYLEEYFWDDFDNRDYNEAVTALMEQLVSWYQSYYNIDAGEEDNYDNSSNGGFVVEKEPAPTPSRGFPFGIVITLLIIVLVIYLIVLADRKRYYSYYTYMRIAPPHRYRFRYMFRRMPHRRWTPPRPPRRPPPGGGMGGFGGPSGGGFGGPSRPSGFGSSSRPGGFGSGSSSSGSGFGLGGRPGGGGAGRSGRPGGVGRSSGSSSSRSGFGSFGGSSFGGRSSGGFGGFGGSGRSGSGFGGGGRSGGGGGGRR